MIEFGVGVLVGGTAVFLYLHKTYLKATENRAETIIADLKAEFAKLTGKTPPPA